MYQNIVYILYDYLLKIIHKILTLVYTDKCLLSIYTGIHEF